MMKKFESTKKVLIHKENGKRLNIVKFNGEEGVKTVDFFGVTSGYPIIALSQLNMEMFEIEEKNK